MRVYIILNGGFALCFGIAFTLNLVYQAEVVGLDPLQLVLVGTALELAAFIFEIPTGIVADVYSRRLSIFIGYVLIACGMLIEGLFPTFAAVLLAQVVWGLGYTFTSGATQAWIADEVGEEQAGKAFVRGAQAGSIGGIIGLVISVPLASVQLNLPLIVGAVLLLGLVLVLIVIMPETGFRPTPSSERSTFRAMTGTFRAGLTLVRGRTILWIVLGTMLITGIYSEGYDRLWRKHILDNFTLPLIGELDPVVWFGILSLGGTLLGLGLQEVARRRLRLEQAGVAARALLLLYGLTTVALLAFSLTTDFGVMLLAFWGISALRATSEPIYDTWLNQHIEPSIRATMFSMSGQVNALGQIAGGPAVGWVGRTFSVRAALLVSGLLLSAQIPLLAANLRREPQTEIIPDA